jgi:MoaA/NifB/PqqE/SkfB family radical SAM enzyme
MTPPLKAKTEATPLKAKAEATPVLATSTAPLPGAATQALASAAASGPDNANGKDSFGPASFPPPSETGISKLLLFPDKLASLLKCSPERPDPLFPISVELSITNRCNLDCNYCSDNKIRNYPDQFNSVLLDRLFAELAEGGTKGVVFEGGGEPLMSPLFDQALKDCLARGLSAGLITNGLLLYGLYPREMLLPRLEWIRVSLDAANRNQYRSIKFGDFFDRAIRAIEDLCRLNPKPVVGVGYVLTNYNDEPAPLRELALRLRDMGCDYLQIRPVVDHQSYESDRSDEIAEALDGISGPSFTVDLAPLTDNLPNGNLNLPCRAHSLSAVVCADTRIFSCGRLYDKPGFLPIGALASPYSLGSFRDAWYGKVRSEQNAFLASPRFCAENCPRCRMTKYNRLLDEVSRLRTRDFI